MKVETSLLIIQNLKNNTMNKMWQLKWQIPRNTQIIKIHTRIASLNSPTITKEI